MIWTDSTQPAQPVPNAPRLFYLDNLRTALICLVILHHMAVIYGAGVPFYYVEPPARTDLIAYGILLIFILLNQAYFMGFLFLISGYFSPGSFDQKGGRQYIVDRLLRLGLPLAIYMFILNPLASVGFWQMPASLTGINTPLTWQVYPFLIAVGPMWFIEMLLIFDLGYAAWRRITRNKPLRLDLSLPAPGYLATGMFIIGLALITYMFRAVVPLGTSTPVLGFPSPAYLPQYISLFILGIIAYRNNWLRSIQYKAGIIWFAVALAAAVLLLPLALTGHFMSLELTQVTKDFTGNGQLQSAFYALFDSAFPVGICLGAMTLSRRFLDSQGTLLKFMSRHSYTVYFIHAPTLVFLALALKGLDVEHLLKFAVASLIGIPLCFAIAFVVRKIPFLSRIM
jgi:glucans biosynthesis protein C